MKLSTFNAITHNAWNNNSKNHINSTFSTYNKTTIYDIFIVEDICARYNLN